MRRSKSKSPVEKFEFDDPGSVSVSEIPQPKRTRKSTVAARPATLDQKVERILAKLQREAPALPAPNSMKKGWSKLGVPEKDIFFLDWDGKEMRVEVVSDKVEETFFTLYAQAYEHEEGCYLELQLEALIPEKILRLLAKYK